MLTIHEPPRQYAVQRETNDGGRVRVGMYATLEEAKEAVVRSIQRGNGTTDHHTIWCASWEPIPAVDWENDVQRLVAANDDIADEEDL
jgi:hypothetical protein